MRTGFFQNFPKIYYDLTGNKARPVIAVNIAARVSFLQTIKDNNTISYSYIVKDSDTPEIIAQKYYGSEERAWIVLLANNIVDPFYDWPLNYDNFIAFIINKYGSVALAQSQNGNYQKIVTKTDSNSGVITTFTYNLDQATFNSLPQQETQVINLEDGNTVSIVTTTQAVTSYDYEWQLNENKRVIRLIDKIYLNQIEQELQQLMAQ